MQLFILFLFISFIIFLFSLYKLGKEDIVFIRKNVALEQLFNIAFITVFFGLFSSRLVYVLANPAKGFLNPLVFILFPYFPGLSLVGGILGGALVLIYYTRQKKLPTSRVLDFFGIALFCAIPFGYVGSIFLSKNAVLLEAVFLPILYLLLFFLIIKLFFPRLIQSSLQQGSIAALSLTLFSLISFLSSLVQNKQGLIWFIDVPEILAIGIFFVSLGFLIRQELTQ